jgi:hypothetical protein
MKQMASFCDGVKGLTIFLVDGPFCLPYGQWSAQATWVLSAEREQTAMALRKAFSILHGKQALNEEVRSAVGAALVEAWYGGAESVVEADNPLSHAEQH